MKKASRVHRGTLLAILAMLGSGLWATQAWGQYGGGSGTAEDPYQIWTAEQMNAIGSADPNDWDNHFKLMAEIDLSGFTEAEFNIIGNETRPFADTFDGSGHAIANLKDHYRSQYRNPGPRPARSRRCRVVWGYR